MKIVSFIVCDDIRREVGGKQTFVGVYDELNLVPPAGKTIEWPIHLKIAFFCRLANDKPPLDVDKYEFIISQSGEPVACLAGVISMPVEKQVENVNLGFIVNALAIKMPGKLDFRLCFKKSDNVVEELTFESLKVKFSSPEAQLKETA